MWEYGNEKFAFAAMSSFEYYHSDQRDDCMKPIES